MSNETELDWLARNVHVWAEDWTHVRKCPVHHEAKWMASLSPNAEYKDWRTKQQWLSRRAELQEKPSWAHAPEWAVYMAQSPNGHWEFFAVKPRAEGWWRHPIGERSSANNASIRGAILGEWRDTLEKRPEEFKQFTSIEDNQGQDMTQQHDMKQDNGWFERGELPPVGTVCLYVVSDRLSAEVEITAHAKFGLCFVEVGKSGENYVSKTAELHRFRPVRTERDVLLSIIVEEMNRYDTDGKLADAILAAGFSLRDK